MARSGTDLKMAKLHMANENVPTPAPTRSYDQILPFATWISVDILQNTNFFRAFTASTSVLTIYIQQFWNTLTYEAKIGACSFQLDEARFVLDANLLREALEITPIDQAHQFVSPPSGDAIMDFVNELGPTKKGRKDKPHVIPYCRFTKLIIYHLGRIHNLHQRYESPLHLAEEDLCLGNLKFVPKGEDNELKREERENMQLPSNSSQSLLKRSQAPASKPKVTREKPVKPSPEKHPKRGKVQIIRKGKSSLQLIDEEEPSQPEPIHQGEGKEYDVERAIQMSLESASCTITIGSAHAKKEKYYGPIYIPEANSATKEASTGPSTQPHDDASANIVRDSPSPADAETGADADKTNSGSDTEILQIGEEQEEDVDNQVNLEEYTAELDQGQAGSDPGKTLESRPLPEQVFMDEDQARPDPRESHVALAGPNPEPTHEEFMANVYPNVHESLKFPTDEHVILEDPLSFSETLSLMKNLNDAYTIRDPFLNDKSTEDEPRKLIVDSEAVSLVTVLIYQAFSLVPPLSTPVIDLSPPKPIPSTTQAPIFIATTTTTTKTLPPPPQQQSTTESKLVARVTTLEQKFSGLEQKSKTLDNTTRNLRSRVFTLKLRDLPHKINQRENKVVKEDVHVALQDPLRDRFRELPEADMKEILHQRMFEIGTYKSLPEHVALYEALEASMERANRDKFLAEKDKSRKRCRNDQDPPLPPPDSDLSKKRRHASDASAPHSEQPVEDVPIPDDVNVSGSEDTDTAHLPKIKTRPD
ncbi:hypothetical protein Tco_1005906 [Tanacetum coccineum]|uniref:Uncharacterized protein n=1 Tax=Tanacetum coccineum TaxID=301880 RepID=A0ABQ5FHG6_9ASTR